MVYLTGRNMLYSQKFLARVANLGNFWLTIWLDDCKISVSDSYNGSEELRLNLSSKQPLNLEIWLTLASKAVFKILSIPCRTNTFFTFYGISINNQGAYTIFTLIFLQLCYGMKVSFRFVAIAHNISCYSFLLLLQAT